MILIEREERELFCSHVMKLQYLEFNNGVFVNRSDKIKKAIRKIRLHYKEFNTKQSKDQMDRVGESIVKYNYEDLTTIFPEYFIQEKDMGVMACNRRGCDNIMCNDHSEVTGYICWECKSELEESNPS